LQAPSGDCHPTVHPAGGSDASGLAGAPAP
jgi:hypothetical protein